MIITNLSLLRVHLYYILVHNMIKIYLAIHQPHPSPCRCLLLQGSTIELALRNPHSQDGQVALGLSQRGSVGLSGTWDCAHLWVATVHLNQQSSRCDYFSSEVPNIRCLGPMLPGQTEVSG